MYMRIIWGRIAPGQWDGFEAAYKKATLLRGDVKGLKNQWLARDRADPDAGYSITLWDTEEDMRAFWDSKKREEAMALLPEEQRTAIILKEYHGMTFQEIADLQGCPLSTVKTRLYQGLAQLRRHLEQNGQMLPELVKRV